MSEKKLTLEEAEDELKRLEKPTHDVDAAKAALSRAEFTGETALIAKAIEDYKAALVAKEASAISQGDVDRAAAVVLDLRGESHTEENILPPDHGLATVLAGRELALAQGELVLSPNGASAQRKVAEAKEKLNDAEKQDGAAKDAHVAESHRRTLAAQSKGSN